jgi:heme exporter protein A
MNGAEQSGEEARLALRDVACRRGDRLLFTGMSLTLAPGEAALVEGPNGVGKSSLLRLVAGLLRPYAGTIERAGAVALADEGLALDPHRTLAEALGFWARIDARPATAVTEALAMLGIGHLAQVPVRLLSTGQRKRAVLARVIAGGAPIWLLDEPGNGLDSAAIGRIGAAAEQHLAGGGIILAASHQPLPWVQTSRLTIAPAPAWA